MTVRNAYTLWKNRMISNKRYCKHWHYVNYVHLGYCSHECHPNVVYGSDTCPPNCTDWCEQDDGVLFRIFMHEYARNPEAFNNEYSIDNDDPDYMETFLLMQCPFCGGEAILHEHQFSKDAPFCWYEVRCSGCGCSSPNNEDNNTFRRSKHSAKANVVEWWNHRV